MPGRASTAVLWLMCAAAICSPAARAAGPGRAPDPMTRIELEPMGFEGLHTDAMLSGSPMLTVDFVDENHMLVTFEVRRLIPREPDAPPGEQDRVVLACLVELPTGKVMTRTEWHLHDRSQYLWNLGQGHFLLRIRDQMSVFAPMAGKPQDAFQTTQLFSTERHILAALVSAEHDLLTVFSTEQPDAAEDDAEARSAKTSSPVLLSFFRMREEPPMLLHATPAGAVKSEKPVVLPMTTAGYLKIVKTGKSAWAFDFDEFSGKVDELPAFDTTCVPRPFFVDHSQFIAFACKGGDERRMLAGFNLRGEEMWQQGFYESYLWPTFSFAPAAGRFALGRVLVPEQMGDFDHLSPALALAEQVRVYQSYTGKQLLQIDCTPIERAGGNFALSPDGMRLAVVREMEVHHKATKQDPAYTGKSTGVEIYTLPALSDQDRSAVKAAELTAPADRGVDISESLARLATTNDPRANKAASADPTPASEAKPAEQPGASAKADTKTSGDTAAVPDASTSADDAVAQPEEPRQPPTLYAPGETPAKDDAKPGGK